MGESAGSDSAPRVERRHATVADVAALAGVSKATVSAVLNGKPSVHGATRERVLEAAEQLDYRYRRPRRRPIEPSAPAPTARTGRCLGIIIREIDNPYFGEVIAGVRAVAEANGFTVVIISSGGRIDLEQRAVALMHEREVDGILVYPVLDAQADLSHFFDLRRRNYPFVLLEGVHGLPASLVDVDNRRAARVAATHLIALGHRRLLHFAGPDYSLHTRERADGVLDACSEATVRFTDAHVIPAGAHLEGGYRAAFAHFSACDPTERPTGIICYNDLVAAGVCAAVSELGLRIPDDVSVVGFDDIAISRYLRPALTTMAIPTHDIGRLATELLLAQIASDAQSPPERHYLQASLVVRGSTGAAPDAPG